MSKHSSIERDHELEQLRKWIEPGDTVYTILEHRAPSGMSRWIRVVLIKIGDNGKPILLHPNYAVATILGLRRDNREHEPRREGVQMSGCGMDMGFEIVYRLGKALWPDGTPEPHGTRNGKPDRDGGYALKHQWI